MQVADPADGAVPLTDVDARILSAPGVVRPRNSANPATLAHFRAGEGQREPVTTPCVRLRSRKRCAAGQQPWPTPKRVSAST